MELEGSTCTVEGAGAIQQGNHNTAQIDNRVYHINIFQKEGQEHVTAEKIKEILDRSMKEEAGLPEVLGAAILDTAMLLYSDPEHPENLTCYMPNKKEEAAMVHNKRGWELVPLKLVLRPMAVESIYAIFKKQPASADYYKVLKELQKNTERYSAGKALRPVLVRNKELLKRALGALPLVGTGGDPRAPSPTRAPSVPEGAHPVPEEQRCIRVPFGNVVPEEALVALLVESSRPPLEVPVEKAAEAIFLKAAEMAWDGAAGPRAGPGGPTGTALVRSSAGWTEEPAGAVLEAMARNLGERFDELPHSWEHRAVKNALTLLDHLYTSGEALWPLLEKNAGQHGR
jgi:hypothetical protein